MLGKSKHQCGLWGSKNRLVTTAGVETSGQMGNEKLRGCGAKSVFKSKCNTPASDHCSKFPARSTFPIQKKRTTALFSCCYYRYFPSPARACPTPAPTPQAHRTCRSAPARMFLSPCAGARALREGHEETRLVRRLWPRAFVSSIEKHRDVRPKWFCPKTTSKSYTSI